jgi:hypothetical protein
MKIKLLKLKDSKKTQSILLNWIIKKEVSNSSLISLDLTRTVKRFVKELETIPLSEELQGNKKKQ